MSASSAAISSSMLCVWRGSPLGQGSRRSESASDASALAWVRVYLNGRLLQESTSPTWRVPATLDRPRRDALAMVVAKDVHGNAAATMLPLR